MNRRNFLQRLAIIPTVAVAATQITPDKPKVKDWIVTKEKKYYGEGKIYYITTDVQVYVHDQSE